MTATLIPSRRDALIQHLHGILYITQHSKDMNHHNKKNIYMCDIDQGDGNADEAAMVPAPIYSNYLNDASRLRFDNV